MMLSRVIPRAAPLATRMVLPVRQASSGGKTDLEFVLEGKRHMDDIPVPKRPWSETYNAAQKPMNTKLAGAVVFSIATMYMGWKYDVLYLEPFSFKMTDVVLTGDEQLYSHDD